MLAHVFDHALKLHVDLYLIPDLHQRHAMLSKEELTGSHRSSISSALSSLWGSSSSGDQESSNGSSFGLVGVVSNWSLDAFWLLEQKREDYWILSMFSSWGAVFWVGK